MERVTNQKQACANMKRAFELRSELFDLANSFAGNERGEVAVTLHHACNLIAQAGKKVKPEITLFAPESFN